MIQIKWCPHCKKDEWSNTQALNHRIFETIFLCGHKTITKTLW